MIMKKSFAIFALMLMAAVGMQAQSLIGTWKTVITEDGEKMDMYFIFSQRTVTIKGVVTQADPEVGTITVSVTVPGTYTRSGNTLSIKLNGEQATINIDKMDLNEEMTKALKEMPELKKMLTEGLEKTMSDGKDELVKDLSSLAGEVEIESLTATELILVEDDEKVTFTRVR